MSAAVDRSRAERRACSASFRTTHARSRSKLVLPEEAPADRREHRLSLHRHVARVRELPEAPHGPGPHRGVRFGQEGVEPFVGLAAQLPGHPSGGDRVRHPAERPGGGVAGLELPRSRRHEHQRQRLGDVRGLDLPERVGDERPDRRVRDGVVPRQERADGVRADPPEGVPTASCAFTSPASRWSTSTGMTQPPASSRAPWRSADFGLVRSARISPYGSPGALPGLSPSLAMRSPPAGFHSDPGPPSVSGAARCGVWSALYTLYGLREDADSSLYDRHEGSE